MAKNIIAIEMDKERHMKLGMNALVQLEKEMGKSVTELGENMSMEDIITVFYVALKWEDKKLSKEKVGDILDDGIEKHGFNYLVEKMGECLQGALGQAQSLPSK